MLHRHAKGSGSAKNGSSSLTATASLAKQPLAHHALQLRVLPSLQNLHAVLTWHKSRVPRRAASAAGIHMVCGLPLSSWLGLLLQA